jgi:hypothetical protein
LLFNNYNGSWRYCEREVVQAGIAHIPNISSSGRAAVAGGQRHRVHLEREASRVCRALR